MCKNTKLFIYNYYWDCSLGQKEVDIVQRRWTNDANEASRVRK